MGGGVAASLARKFPRLEKAYQEHIALCVKNADPEFVRGYLTEDGDILCEGDLMNGVMLGKVQLVKVAMPELYVCNVFGQGEISRNRRMTSYDATVEAFEAISNAGPNSILSYIMNSGLPLYFPYKMGCGLGGGDWQIYSAIIECYFPNAIICRFGGEALV